MGCTKRGGGILIARNCHKSVYYAIELNELHAVYLYPEMDQRTGLNGEIRVEAVREALGKYGKEIQAVMITSPTYDGVVSDIRAIAEAVHEFGIPLIVDEAHGATFRVSSIFSGKCKSAGGGCGDPQCPQDAACSDPDGLTSYEWESGRSGGCTEISAYFSSNPFVRLSLSSSLFFSSFFSLSFSVFQSKIICNRKRSLSFSVASPS